MIKVKLLIVMGLLACILLFSNSPVALDIQSMDRQCSTVIVTTAILQCENEDNHFNSDNSNLLDIEYEDSIYRRYINKTPHQWSQTATGVKTHIDTDEKVIAFTFDACGGKNGNGCDSKLIEYLTKEAVPATLFINSRWIDANHDTFIALYKNPLFEIESHGASHKPLSVNGKSAYGIKGTESIFEAAREVLLSRQKIEKITGKKTKFFRSGTNYYDEIAVKISNRLGQQVIGYNVLGDAGATFSAEQVKTACINAKSGSIIILHMNHPEKHTAEGVIKAIPILKNKGYRFVKLEDYYSKLE